MPRLCKQLVFLFAAQLTWGQVDARQLMVKALANVWRSLEARLDYTYTSREEVRHLGSDGKVQSTEITVKQVVSAHGAPLEKPVSFNGGPATLRQQRMYTDALAKIQSRPEEEAARRRAASLKNFVFVNEVAGVMRFRLLGEENTNRGPAYVIEAVPVPGSVPESSQAKFISNVKAKVWVDKRTVNCQKVEATFTRSCSVGSLFARIQPGSRILLEQKEVGEGVWLPLRIELRAEAKLLMLIGYYLESITTFSDYVPVQRSTTGLVVGSRKRVVATGTTTTAED